MSNEGPANTNGWSLNSSWTNSSGTNYPSLTSPMGSLFFRLSNPCCLSWLPDCDLSNIPRVGRLAQWLARLVYTKTGVLWTHLPSLGITWTDGPTVMFSLPVEMDPNALIYPKFFFTRGDNRR